MQNKPIIGSISAAWKDPATWEVDVSWELDGRQPLLSSHHPPVVRAIWAFPHGVALRLIITQPLREAPKDGGDLHAGCNLPPKWIRSMPKPPAVT